MNDNIRITAQRLLSKGYLTLKRYTLSMPSLKSSKTLTLSDREVVHSADSVHVLLYAPEADAFLLCEEFRVGVFFNQSQDDPFIVQCVAGTVERDETPAETAYKEVREETGYEVDALTLITSLYKSPGLLTEKTHLYYAELTGTPAGGVYGIGEEEIKTHLIKREAVLHQMKTHQIVDSATWMALQWFLAQSL